MFRPQKTAALWRRATASLVALSLALGSLGVPLPGKVKPASDEAFPCMNCACSCSEAETCWRQCCCMTDQQKLVWAARNGVVPPSFVVARARAQAVQTCSAGLVRSCCAKRSQAEAPQRDDAPTGVLVWQDLRCRGLSIGWMTVAPSVSSEDLLAFQAGDELEEPVCVVTPLVFTPSYDCDTPPPQFG